MRKKILFSIILTIFLLLMLPSIQAVENNVYIELVKNIQKSETYDVLKLEIATNLKKINKVNQENQELLEKINELFVKIHEQSTGNSILLTFALIWFLFGIYNLLDGDIDKAKLDFQLCILYIILYLLL